MIVLVQANVLTVGLNGKGKALKDLPIRLIKLQTAAEAVRYLRSEKIDGVISSWELEDSADGGFLKMLKAVKPNIPTIALVRLGDMQQEIAARSLGVCAVLTEATSDELLCMAVSNVLKLGDIEAMHVTSGQENQRSIKDGKITG